MAEKRVRIEVDRTDMGAFSASCGGETVLELKPDSLSSPALIDIIMALLDTSSAMRPPPVYLGADLYTESLKEGFGNSKERVRHIPRHTQWLFAARHDNHWVAVDINWAGATIGVYDPQVFRAGGRLSGGRLASERRDRITKVRPHP